MAKEQDVYRRAAIGRNLANARLLAGYTQDQVAQKIWGNIRLKNRVSEVESGRLLPDIEVLAYLCEMYGVSADYILGFSVEPEIDQTAGRVGLLYNSIQELISEQVRGVTLQICNAAAQHIAVMPKPQNQALLETAKQVLRVFSRHRGTIPADIGVVMLNLADVVREVDCKLALAMQSYDVAVTNVTERYDLKDGHLISADVEEVKRRTKAKAPVSFARAGRKNPHQSTRVAQAQLHLFVQSKVEQDAAIEAEGI
ncbi:MAG: hypothetical protein RLY58_2346 [Pseudomonadota bacterium]|jgi:transcriptional regulator with XRE-family HTH domain